MVSSPRRVASALVLLVGVYFIVLPFALSLFSRTRDAEDLNAYYRPLMSDQGIQQFGTNLRIVDEGGDELFSVVIPQLERTLDMSDAQFRAYVAQNYPHIATFVAGAPQLLELLNPATQAVLAQKNNFRDADQFPVANIRMDLGPWALLLLGAALIALGLLLRVRTSPVVVAASFAVGAGLLVGPLALGWFHETDAAEKVAQAARPPFSPAVATTVVDNIYKIDAAFTEMRTALFPALAQQLGKSSTEMDAFVRSSFPKTSTLLDAWDREMFKGAHDLSLSQIEFMDEFHNADATPYRALPWLIMAPGLLLFAAGGLAFRRRSG